MNFLSSCAVNLFCLKILYLYIFVERKQISYNFRLSLNSTWNTRSGFWPTCHLWWFFPSAQFTPALWEHQDLLLLAAVPMLVQEHVAFCSGIFHVLEALSCSFMAMSQFTSAGCGQIWMTEVRTVRISYFVYKREEHWLLEHHEGVIWVVVNWVRYEMAL